MTERPDEPVLDPADEERVRRLLADARHTEPMPADVVRRMEEVLADLRGTPSTVEPAEAEAPVVALAARRRRLRSGLLLAAAAVVTAGFAVPALLPTMRAADESAGGGADTAMERVEGQAEDAERAPAASDFAALPESGAERSTAIAGLPRVRRDQFAKDARRLASRVPTLGDPRGPAAEGPVDCTPPVELGEQLVPVRYAGRRAVLVFAEADEGAVTVRLYRCGAAEPLRRATIPGS